MRRKTDFFLRKNWFMVHSFLRINKQNEFMVNGTFMAFMVLSCEFHCKLSLSVIVFLQILEFKLEIGFLWKHPLGFLLFFLLLYDFDLKIQLAKMPLNATRNAKILVFFNPARKWSVNNRKTIFRCVVSA